MPVKTHAAHCLTSTLRLSGMDCPDCASTIEKKVRSIDGVCNANVNFATAKLVMEIDPELTSLDKVMKAVGDAGYQAEPDTPVAQPASRPLHQRLHLRDVLMAISGLLVTIGFASSVIGQQAHIVTIFYAAAIATGGYFTARRGIAAVRSLSLDINFLMMIAVIGAAAIGDWAEGATVVFLFAFANTLESYTVNRARNSIKELMDLAPIEALVNRHGHFHRLPVAEIEVGDIILAKPGDKIAMDGIVVGGASSVNQAPITGESMPVEKRPGDPVFAGTINQRGSLEIQVTRPFEDNTLSRIIHLVEEAQAKRAPSQQFVDRFAKYYTPAVIAIAVGVAGIPPLLGEPWYPWLYRALALLVVSCPCALVISTPISIVSAIANASRHGVLIKGGAYLEQTGAVSMVAFDKTGTLTRGRPEITDIVPLNGHLPAQILSIAASIEHDSEHPLAEAILRKARVEGLPLRPVRDFESITGLGVSATLENTAYYVGSIKLFQDLGFACPDAYQPMRNAEARPDSAQPAYSVKAYLDSYHSEHTSGACPDTNHHTHVIGACDDCEERGAGASHPICTLLNTFQDEGKTIVVLGTKDGALGVMAIADELRAASKDAIGSLHQHGIERVVMLTGDNETTARAIASKLGIDEYHAGLLPEDKVGVVQRLLASHGKVAMIGDGVNDAPALATATVGIAMGTAGSDAALETADIALMADDLSKVPYVVALSRRTLRIIKQNIMLALLVKSIFLALAFPGWLTLWLAVVGDMGISLVVIANGMRLLRTEK